MPISVRTVPCLSAEVRCAPQAAHLAPACADADGLEIPASACNRAFRGFAWRYSDRYHEDLSSCVLYSQLRSCRVPDGLTADQEDHRQMRRSDQKAGSNAVGNDLLRVERRLGCAIGDQETPGGGS